MRLQPLEQGSQKLLCQLQLLFELPNSLLQRLGAVSLILDLAVLDEVPEESHGRNDRSFRRDSRIGR